MKIKRFHSTHEETDSEFNMLMCLFVSEQHVCSLIMYVRILYVPNVLYVLYKCSICSIQGERMSHLVKTP